MRAIICETDPKDRYRRPFGRVFLVRPHRGLVFRHLRRLGFKAQAEFNGRIEEGFDRVGTYKGSGRQSSA
jgi:hypothetical protein